jgi:hypothetical protein
MTHLITLSYEKSSKIFFSRLKSLHGFSFVLARKSVIPLPLPSPLPFRLPLPPHSLMVKRVLVGGTISFHFSFLSFSSFFPRSRLIEKQRKRPGEKETRKQNLAINKKAFR